MKKSELNKNVLENFALWYTHKDREEAEEETGLKDVFQLSAVDFYKAIDSYIEEDHVDGKGNSEDHIVTFGAESSYEVEDEDREYPEQVVVVADFGEEEGTQTACFIESTDVKGVNNLLEYIKDPYGKKI